jgi:hypothetical protein
MYSAEVTYRRNFKIRVSKRDHMNRVFDAFTRLHIRDDATLQASTAQFNYALQRHNFGNLHDSYRTHGVVVARIRWLRILTHPYDKLTWCCHTIQNIR